MVLKILQIMFFYYNLVFWWSVFLAWLDALEMRKSYYSRISTIFVYYTKHQIWSASNKEIGSGQAYRQTFTKLHFKKSSIWSEMWLFLTNRQIWSC